MMVRCPFALVALFLVRTALGLPAYPYPFNVTQSNGVLSSI
jgi:hypothetical protein